jgi:hypothetical protein
VGEDKTLAATKLISKTMVWIIAIVVGGFVIYFSPIIIIMATFIFADKTPPMPRDVLAERFPEAIVGLPILVANYTPNQMVKDDMFHDIKHFQEGGACAVYRIEAPDTQLTIKSKAEEYTNSNPDMEGRTCNIDRPTLPNQAVCGEILYSKWKLEDSELLSFDCDTNQTWAIFYNKKLNEISVENVDWDSDHIGNLF